MTMSHFSLDRDEAGIAWLTMDVKGRSVNVMAHEVMAELYAAIDELVVNPPVGFVFQSGKERGFIFGADINEFAGFQTKERLRAHIDGVLACFQKIEDLPCPTIILVDGICVGGGLELALAFDRIIAVDTPSCQFGFPEINLGLLPGYGGSARAYERMGLAGALKLVLYGRSLKARDAFDANIVDHLVPARDDLAAAACQAVDGGILRRSRPVDGDHAAIIDAERVGIEARMRVENTPAPFGILDHYSEKEINKNKLLKSETDLFCELMMTPASIGLRRNFQLVDAVKKGGRGDPQVTHIHVIGAGTMGGDIAAVAAMTGFQVTLQDISADAVDAAVTRARKLFERRLKDPQKIEAALSRLKADQSGDGLADADLMIEAVAENLQIKQAVFADAETRMKPDAILATNTSAIPLQQIGEVLSSPDRLVGMHFFNPVPVLPLVEIVYTDSSRKDFIDRAMYVCGAMKKQPIRCKSSPGFLVNRALLPYLFKSVEALLDGANPDMLDEALVRFGMPMGPIELCDQIGLDVCLDAGLVIGMSDQVKEKLTTMRAAGTLGRKTGSGFYEWDDRTAIRPRAPYDESDLAATASDLLAPLVAECRSAIAEGVVDSADMADAACIFGIGFPAFRGGPVFWDESQTA